MRVVLINYCHKINFGAKSKFNNVNVIEILRRLLDKIIRIQAEISIKRIWMVFDKMNLDFFHSVVVRNLPRNFVGKFLRSHVILCWLFVFLSWYTYSYYVSKTKLKIIIFDILFQTSQIKQWKHTLIQKNAIIFSWDKQIDDRPIIKENHPWSLRTTEKTQWYSKPFTKLYLNFLTWKNLQFSYQSKLQRQSTN